MIGTATELRNRVSKTTVGYTYTQYYSPNLDVFTVAAFVSKR